MGPGGPIRAIAVVAAVIRARRQDPHHPASGGLAPGRILGFPGGKSLPGETDREALARELREELGVSATVGEPLEVVEWHYPDKHVRIEFFRCVIEGEPRPLEGPGDGVGRARRARAATSFRPPTPCCSTASGGRDGGTRAAPAPGSQPSTAA